MAEREESVLFEVDDGVVIITLNEPHNRNALGRDVRKGLFAAFRKFEADPSLSVAVLTGAGSSFCAGGNLKEMAAEQLRVPPPDYAFQLGRNVPSTKPVIAAVAGAALAGGFLLAQTCDLCIASEDARFGIAEVKWGRGAPWAAPLLWMVPQRIMLELLLTGEPIDADRAFQIGLVNEVVAAGDLLPRAVALARTIAGNAPLSVRAARRMVYLTAELPRSAALEAADAIYEPVYLSDDAQEGPLAFREKRKPMWTGR